MGIHVKGKSPPKDKFTSDESIVSSIFVKDEGSDEGGGTECS